MPRVKEKVEIEDIEPDAGDQDIDEDEFVDALNQMRSFLKRFGKGKYSKKRKSESEKEEKSAKKYKSDDYPKSKKRLSKKDNIKTHD